MSVTSVCRTHGKLVSTMMDSAFEALATSPGAGASRWR